MTQLTLSKERQMHEQYGDGIIEELTEPSGPLTDDWKVNNFTSTDEGYRIYNNITEVGITVRDGDVAERVCNLLNAAGAC